MVLSVLVAAPALLHGPASADVQLEPVLTTGLASPLYVTHARDGSRRLFIVQQGGVIKVLRPGGITPTEFLNITTKVLSGGEQGLLGLAFHPQYPTTGRFFVNYTRRGDGATVIAEYHVSASNADVADPAETVILTVSQPFANHNGGMTEFGPDGFLYVGLGDGGSANDPGNRAQNIGELLGKILRIDIDHANGTVPYSSPPDNPFFGQTLGRDEIYALGFRNPWRFSFDRATGDLIAGDVGQDAIEEVDLVILGRNYGWRVFEGTQCTVLDPAACGKPGFTPPIAEYSHTGGRCSITGGYVYRGSRSTLPLGTYVFGDYCTGEIFTLQGSTSILLLDSGLNIASFGEDESGEIYVVGLGGTVHRLASTTPPCAYSIDPVERSFPAAGGEGTAAVSTSSGCAWTAASSASWISITSGDSGSGAGTTTYSVAANLTQTARTGTLTMAGQTHTVTQGAAPASCTYVLSPTRRTFPGSGGTDSVAVTAADGCVWTAVSNTPWITIMSGQAGAGAGTVTYVVTANDGRRSRTGTMTIAGQTFTVKQRGR